MNKSRTLLIVFRIILVSLSIWFSYGEMMIYALYANRNNDINFMLFIAIELFIIVALTALDFLLLSRLRKKEGRENVAVYSAISSGVFAGITLIPFLVICFLGGFEILINSIEPLVVEVVLLSEFLYWLFSGVIIIKKK